MKTKFKGSKGKWSVEINEESNGYVNVVNEYIENEHPLNITVYGEYTTNTGIPTEQTIANATLIANAPEMLELLQELENDDETIPTWIWVRIQKIIMKTIS